MLTPDSKIWNHINDIFYSEEAKQQTDFALYLSAKQKNFFHALYKQPWFEFSRRCLYGSVTDTTDTLKLTFNLSQFPAKFINTEIFIPEVNLYESLQEMMNNRSVSVYENNLEELNKDLWKLTTKLSISFIHEHKYNHDLVILFGKQLSSILDKFKKSQDKMLYLPTNELKKALQHPSASKEQQEEVTKLFRQITQMVRKENILRPFFAVSNAAKPVGVPNSINNNNNNNM